MKLDDGRTAKYHINQLRSRHCSTDESSPIDSLPDDLFNTNTNSNLSPTHTTSPSTPRYPLRVRRPPDRFTPP